MLLNRIEFILRQMQLASPDLMPLLEDHDPGVRYLALAVLERHKTVEPATAVAAVRAVLGDPVLRSVGQRAEWSREPAAVAAIGAELAKAPPAEDQLVLLAMLSRAGLAQPGVEGSMLLERLEHPEAGVRQAAVVVLALGAAGDGRAAIAVAGRLQDPARSVRRSALMHLRLLLDKGRGAGKHEIAAEDSLALVKLLLAALPEDDAEQTRRIVGLLGQMQADASPAVPHLLRMLAHEKTPAVRSSVADALAAIAAPSGTNGAVPQTRQVQAALEAVLRDDDSPQVRLAAAEALGRLGQTEAAVAAVIELLRRYSNSFLRTSAARALANYGPQAKDAVSPLVKVVERDPGFVKQQAAAALAAIGSEGIAALTRLLVDQRQPDEVREVAGQALLRAGADKERLVAALVELSRSTEEAERRRAAVYLAELGERPDVAAAVLAAEYRAEEIGSWRLLGSLAKLGPPAVEPLLSCWMKRGRRTRANS